MKQADQKLPNMLTHFSDWYQAVVKRGNLAEHSGVRGAMIIKTDGFALWEQIRHAFDKRFKEVGIQNAYFPLLIPVDYLNKEAKHVAGFAKECAVVTHHRLKTNAAGEIVVDPTALLERPMVVRPTSETIIWAAYKKWIQSYRDLPLKLNQWANVVRWEMRTRLFLRTSEFLWQEGHTAHATQSEAQAQAIQMWHIYAEVIRNKLAIPAVQGTKTAHERFAGAEETYTLEALMKDGKALQLGTSHFLGENFGKAFDVTYTNDQGVLQTASGTSFGVTTRLIGAMVMSHSDQKGLVLPPEVAPIQVVLLPILLQKGASPAWLATAERLAATLVNQGVRVHVEKRSYYTMGQKFKQYEEKGVPIQLVLGAKEEEKQLVLLKRRDTGEQLLVPQENLTQAVKSLLQSIQKELLVNAQKRQEARTFVVESYDAFKKQLRQKKGFIVAHWDRSTETEQAIQAETQATIRCIPQTTSAPQKGKCVYTGAPSPERVLFAQAY